MELPFKVDLRDRVALVTGGGGVLCSCMAEALAACGARVAVLGRRLEPLQSVVARIRAAGGQAMAVTGDVLDRATLERARGEIETAWGGVDILVNGAGGNHPKATAGRERLEAGDLAQPPGGPTSFFDLTSEGVQEVFNLNFLGTLLPTQVFARGMAVKGRGVVINVSSMSALRPLTKVAAYSAAKAAVNNFTQWLAVHLSRTGVRVNAIAPGFFLTEQNRALLTTPAGELTPRGRTIQAHTPLGRFGQADELVGALLWLASDRAAGFVTGTVVAVDGGFSAFSGV
jgi:NAD(P)-dependent dehydrogenase (short-subunit alcohol dehydrogenase family)